MDIKGIVELKPKMAFLQAPDGLLKEREKLAEELEKKGIETIISAEPCFGSCDLREHEARALGCDLIVHMGHSDFGVKTKIPVVYLERKSDFDPIPVLEKGINNLKGFDNIGLISAAQFSGSLGRAKDYLESKGFRTFAAKGGQRYPGQITGCDISAAKRIENDIDCFLFIGTGIFHPIGVSLESEKPVLLLDAERLEMRDIEKGKREFEKKRWASIAKASEAETFGILVSTKPGQMNLGSAFSAKTTLEDKGKKAFILAVDFVSPEKVEYLADAFINTACPRLGLEDISRFGKPIVNLNDLGKLLETIKK